MVCDVTPPPHSVNKRPVAESQSMTTPEVVAKTLIAEHADFLAEAVAMVAAQLMEAEISVQIGAGKGEVSPGRATHRNGYRERLWETRVGEIELAIPKKRSETPTSRASWSRENAPSRRSSRW